MRLYFLAVLQLSTIFLLIIQVAANTKSNKPCTNDKGTLQLTIETGERPLAGTDDIIHLFLRNFNGALCWSHNLNNPGNDRERNSVDEYTICCPEGFMPVDGDLSMLAFNQMGMNDKNGRIFVNDWFIERIEVRADKGLFLSYRFHAWTKSMTPWLFGVSKIGNNTYIRF
jgi:hypothetical protein